MPMVPSNSPFGDPSVQILADIRRGHDASYIPNAAPTLFAPNAPSAFAPPRPPPLPDDLDSWPFEALARARPHFM